MGMTGLGGGCRMGIRQLQRLNNLQTENIFENDVLLVTDGEGERATSSVLPPGVSRSLPRGQ